MSNGREHRRVGFAVGGFAAFVASDEGSALWHRLVETLGGMIGGWAGGKLPDILEPAVHGWHRDLAHSMTTAGGIVAGTAKAAASWQCGCRSRAEYFAARRRATGIEPAERLLFVLAELFWRLAAGALVGAAAGYLSHLALDGTTPRSIPLLTRGF